MVKSKRTIQVIRLFCLVIIVLALLFGSIKHTSANVENTIEASDRPYQVVPTSEMEEFSPFLYPNFQWTKIEGEVLVDFRLGNETGMKKIVGTAYQSEPFEGKPSNEVIEYYYINRLRSLGWEYVGFMDESILFSVQYYHPDTAKGLSIKVGRCSQFTENSVELSETFCIQVWLSSVTISPAPEIQDAQELEGPNVVGHSEDLLTPQFQNPLPVPFFSQRVDSYKNIVLGYGSTCTSSLYDSGCAVASYSMIYSYYQPGFTNPANLNNALKVAPGLFAPGLPTGCNNYWPDYVNLPDAPSGVSGSARVYNSCSRVNCIDDNNVTLIDNELNQGHPVHARVHWSGQPENVHSIVIIGHSGSTFFINDPWARNAGVLTLETGDIAPYIVDWIMATHGTPPEDPNGCENVSGSDVRLYEDSNCSGRSITFNSPGPRNTPELGFNDNVSSMYVPSNWSVRVFEHDFGNGSSRCWSQSAWDFSKDWYTSGNTGLNIDNTISSIEVYDNSTCSGGGFSRVVLYDGKDYRDSSIYTYYNGLIDVSANFNDRGESIFIPQNRSARLYKNNTEDSPSVCMTSPDNDLWGNSFSDGSTVANETSYMRIYDNTTCYLPVTCYTLTRNINPSGTGNIGVNPSPNCNGSQYTSGTTVQLTANPNSGYSFSSWSGDVSGNSATTTVTMNGNRNVTANFSSAVPPTPSNFRFTGSTQNTLSLAWNDVSNETGYRIFEWNGSSFVLAHTLGANVTSFTDTGLNCNADYFYELAAYNSVGESTHEGWISEKTAACPVTPPSAPSLSNPSNNTTINRFDSVNLSWNTSSGATSYYAEFWGGPNNNLNSGWISGTSWSVGSQWGGPYQWRVKARNSSGESPWSETRSLTIKYGTPGSLNASPASRSQINLTWTASADAPANIDGYRIYRNGTSITTVGASTTSFSDTGRTCNTSYSYVVRAYKGSLESDSSNTATASTSTCPVTAVNDLFPNSISITTAPYQHTIDNSDATTSGDDPNLASCNRNQGAHTIWYRYRPTTTREISIDTYKSNYDTMLAVWTGSQGNLTSMGCNDDNSGGFQSALSVRLTANTTYYIEIAEYNGLYNAPAQETISEPPKDIIAPEAVGDHVTQLHITSFADVTGSHSFWRWIEGFYRVGITTGCAANPVRYCPDRPVTRAEMAVFILRAQNGASYQPYPYQVGIFADVPTAGKEWMKPWIEQFYLNGITTGCGANPLQYCPEREVTRAEMAVFILRAKHGRNYQPPAATGIFTDLPVAGKAWMQPWVEQFYREGITTGCGVNPLRYCPERSVTRADMAVFIGRAYNITQLP